MASHSPSVLITANRARATRWAARNPTALVVTLSDPDPQSAAPGAEIEFSLRDPQQAQSLKRALHGALKEAVPAPLEHPPVLRVPSKEAIERLGAALVGTIAVVRVTQRNRRHLLGRVEALREAGVAGIQLVWDGQTPPRESVEPWVFAVLEKARATPQGAPVVLAPSEAVVAALLILIDAQRRKAKP